MKKIWLDTDIGSDIDDAAALAYLLANPNCDLLGISTVTGQPSERAKVADALCKLAGKDIPIYPGVEAPLLAEQRQPDAKQARLLHGFPHSEAFPENHAIEAMYDVIRQNPGEVTLLAIGPLTNVALLFATYPDAPALLKDAVLMCGDFFGRAPYRCESEWNSVCDPHATAIVFNAKKLRVRSVGLDVTAHVVMEIAEVTRRFTSPLLQAIYKIGDFGGERMSITYHDPLAAVSVFHPEVMQYHMGQVSVHLANDRVFGRTYFDKDSNGPHEAAETVDIPAFYEHFFRYL